MHFFKNIAIYLLLCSFFTNVLAATQGRVDSFKSTATSEVTLSIPEILSLYLFDEQQQVADALVEFPLVFDANEREVSFPLCIYMNGASQYSATFSGTGEKGTFSLEGVSYRVSYDNGSGEQTVDAGVSAVYANNQKDSTCDISRASKITVSLLDSEVENNTSASGVLTVLLTII